VTAESSAASETLNVSPMSSPNARLPSDEIAAAAERRAQASPPTDHLTELELHEKRQHFRRLIDPGILRPNAKDVALSSLEVGLFHLEGSYPLMCNSRHC
jgi:hypothetical protein